MSTQNSRLLLTIVFFLLALVAANAFSTVYAQGIIIDPPPFPIDPPPRPGPLPSVVGPITIDEHRVEAVIDGPVAQVHVTQVFHNETKQTVEGIYVFPLPENAAVSDFQMTVDGKVLEGKLYNKEEARRIYEEIVRKQRDPALLEYIGRNLFQTSVFPIPPGASRKLELSYAQVVNQREGLYAFTYPLRTQQYSKTPVKTLAISIELRNQKGVRTIYSPNYKIDVTRDGDSGAKIGYEASNVQPESDFTLFFGASQNEIGLNLLSYKPAGEDGFFVLLAAPGIAADAQQVVARDIVLVLDVSGSMQGEKIEQARKAAHFVVDHLNPGDHFNLISFSTGTHLWQNDLQPADAQIFKSAHSWINALVATGSTDINRGLLEALAQLNSQREDGRPGYLLFLTDGLPTVGETEPQRILVNAQNNQPAKNRVRLFTFGVGFDVNTDLLDALSQDLGGRSSYVKPDEAIDEKVGQFYSGISTPVLVDVALDWGNQVQVDEVYPYPLPDLFAGEQLVVAGRYHQGGTVNLTLRGTVNGQKASYHYPGQTLVSSGGEAFVARLWATRKIGVLLDQIRRNGPDKEIVDEITQLSLQYGIATPYTSYLITEAPSEPAQAGTTQDGQADHNGTAPQAAEPTRESVYAQAQAAAAAPASGEAAVKASESRSALREATQVAEDQAMRYVNGKAFVQQGLVNTPDGQTVALWVDSQYKSTMALEKVRFGSSRYFELLKQPNLAKWLAVSSELIVVAEKDKAIRISNSD